MARSAIPRRKVEVPELNIVLRFLPDGSGWLNAVANFKQAEDHLHEMYPYN